MDGPPAGPRYRDEFAPNRDGPDRHPHVRERTPFGNESHDVVIEEMVSQMKGRDRQVVFRMMHQLYERLRIVYSDFHIPLYEQTKSLITAEIRKLFPEDSVDYLNAMRAYKLVYEGFTETQADTYYKYMLEMHKRLLKLERRQLPPNSD